MSDGASQSSWRRHMAADPKTFVTCAGVMARSGASTENPRAGFVVPRPNRVDSTHCQLKAHPIGILAGRLKIGEELPPLRSDGKAGQALRQYLGRREVWKALQAEAEAVGETLTPYSLRHRFSKEAHRLGIPVLDICRAMGHSLEVHQSNYSRFMPDSTAAAFEKALLKD